MWYVGLYSTIFRTVVQAAVVRSDSMEEALPKWQGFLIDQPDLHYPPNSAGRTPCAQSRIASQSRASPSAFFIAFIISLIGNGSLL
jgi:hypothetical protein